MKRRLRTQLCGGDNHVKNTTVMQLVRQPNKRSQARVNAECSLAKNKTKVSLEKGAKGETP